MYTAQNPLNFQKIKTLIKTLYKICKGGYNYSISNSEVAEAFQTSPVAFFILF